MNYDCLESNTLWSLDESDIHKNNYPGSCSGNVIKNLILKYSKYNDIVLDQFLGSGTTLIESIKERRKCIGIDINIKAINISKEKVETLNGQYKILQGDARKLFLHDESVDFICTQPPYNDRLKYSYNNRNDLSLLDIRDYYASIVMVANEAFRVLRKDKFCAIIVGDIRKNGYIEPLGFKIMNIFQQVGFKLKEVIIKEQSNNSNEKWIEIAKKKNFLLIRHEYIFIFKKVV